MISRTAEYALRTVVYLGHQIGDPQTVTEIADSIRAPNDVVTTLLQGLRRAGIVHAPDGVCGGFTLAKAADDISLLQVVEAVNALQPYSHCPLGALAHDSGLCPLHQPLDRLMAEAEFRDATINDVLNSPSGNHVCHFPCISQSTGIGR
jgi:Rrf2 family protein